MLGVCLNIYSAPYVQPNYKISAIVTLQIVNVKNFYSVIFVVDRMVKIILIHDRATHCDNPTYFHLKDTFQSSFLLSSKYFI